jgi:hypothetical protein
MALIPVACHKCRAPPGSRKSIEDRTAPLKVRTAKTCCCTFALPSATWSRFARSLNLRLSKQGKSKHNENE